MTKTPDLGGSKETSQLDVKLTHYTFLPFPSLLNKTVTLERHIRTWGSKFSPTWSVHLFPVWSHDPLIVSDLEVLFLIPSTSRSTTNHSSVSWSSWLGKVKSTTSAKGRDNILKSPNLITSTSWLWPGWVADSKSELLLPMQNKLTLW